MICNLKYSLSSKIFLSPPPALCFTFSNDRILELTSQSNLSSRICNNVPHLVKFWCLQDFFYPFTLTSPPPAWWRMLTVDPTLNKQLSRSKTGPRVGGNRWTLDKYCWTLDGHFVDTVDPWMDTQWESLWTIGHSVGITVDTHFCCHIPVKLLVLYLHLIKIKG